VKKVSLQQPAQKIETRCSSLPELFTCRNSIVNPDGLQEVEVLQGAAGLGTEIHAVIQKTIETGVVDFRKIERMYGPEDVERAKALFATGLATVEDASKQMKNMQFEIEVSFESDRFVVTGHVDILDADSDRAYVVDFKTGRVHQDHTHQMVGYAVGAWNKMGRPDKYTVKVAYVYLESGEATTFELSADDMRDWLKELDSLPERYVVSNRCVYCKLNNTCPAFRDYLKGSMELLTSTSGISNPRIRKLPDSARAKLAAAVKMARTATDRIREYIKAEAIERGPIANGDGTEYIIKNRKHHILLTSKALPILAKYLTPKDIMNATTLRLNEVLTAATRRTLGPMRKVIRTELMDRLTKAGAIVTSESAYLETAAIERKDKWQSVKKKLKNNPLNHKGTIRSKSKPSKRHRS
jgi:hypothetical protein